MPAVSVYEEVLSGVKTAIDALSLSGIAATVIEDVPQRNNRTLPYVSVCTPLQGESSPEGTNQRDVWSYPVQVAIIAATSTTKATVLSWRQSIKRRFSNANLIAGAITLGTEMTVSCTPSVPIDPVALQAHQVYVSVLLVNVKVKEARS